MIFYFTSFDITDFKNKTDLEIMQPYVGTKSIVIGTSSNHEIPNHLGHNAMASQCCSILMVQCILEAYNGFIQNIATLQFKKISHMISHLLCSYSEIQDNKYKRLA